MIHAVIAPAREMAGSTYARTLARTASSDQSHLPTKCSIDWCRGEARLRHDAAVRSGAVMAAIGSTLLRSAGINSPVQ